MLPILLVLIITAFGSVGARAVGPDYGATAEKILKTYTSSWSELPLDKQKHWALRMYRVTGDTTWYPAIRADFENTLVALRVDLDSLGDSSYAMRRVDTMLSSMEWGSRKNEVRRSLFEDKPQMLLQLNLLYNLATVDDYLPEDTAVGAVFSRARQLIRPTEIAAFLIDSATITAYGPQAANAVEYLRQLGFGDYRQAYIATFRQVFPDTRDNKLDDREFADKVYGLTHMIIAASGYYQRMVDPEQFRWVLEYFASRKKRIVKHLSSDIIAEVGLSFLLCGESTHKMVGDCRKALSKEFDRQVGLIRSVNGNSDLISGEHRNILAYILFNWPSQLNPGPRIY